MNIGEPIITGRDKESVDRLKFIFSTPKGSVPLERDLGIDFDIVDMPIEVAKGKIIEAYEQVRDHGLREAQIPPLWDGRAAERTVEALTR